MARPQKEGLDYFPLDVDIDQDDKLTVTIAKFGMEGFGIIIKLMTEIYKNGYFYPWTEKEQYIFSSKINADYEKVIAIVNECIKWGFFHQKLYEEHSILTSMGFQKRFLLASNRRKDVKIDPSFMLEEKAQKMVENELMQTESELLHTETPKKSALSTQSKVKEIKVKEIKINNKNPSRQKRIFAETDIEFRIAKALYEKILTISPNIKTPDLQKWSDHVRLMVEQDKRSTREIIEVCQWMYSPVDTFWRTVILSTKNLREKFDQLNAKRLNPNVSTKGTSYTKADKNKNLLLKHWESEEDEKTGYVKIIDADFSGLPDGRTD